MTITGRVNVDTLIHDKTQGAFKLIDVESSSSVSTKAALITGTASESGVSIDPTATGVRDSEGDEISFSSVASVVLKGSADLVLTATASSVVLKTEANECGVSATPNQGSATMTVQGSGSFQLVLIGT